MVFRGRPSKGCGECRRKKIRCDQNRPCCSQCLKSRDGRPCPGYRDEQSLKFFDESSEVARKAQTKQVIKLQRRDRETNCHDIPSHSSPRGTAPSEEASAPLSRHASSESSPEPSVSYALVPSVESQGIRYFLANFAMDDLRFCSGHFSDLLSWKIIQSKTLQVAMAAVGLAGLSNQRSDPRIMTKARQQYASALRMTKSHLADPSACRQNRTITAIALLGLFEIMTCSSPMSLRSWMNHVDGSIALLKLRGTDLLKSESGAKVFTQARAQILISCYQRECHIPPIVLELSRQLSLSIHLSSRAANEILGSVSSLCELRASIKDGTLTDPIEIIASFLALEAEIVKWRADRGPEFDHTTIFTSPSPTQSPGSSPFASSSIPSFSDPENIYDSTYATYTSPLIAGACNVYRTTRVFIAEAVLAYVDVLLNLPQSPTMVLELHGQRTKSLATISEMTSEVCSSVPYLLGHDKPRHEQLTNPAPAAGGYFLLTSLYTAGSTIGVPHSMRAFVLSRLKYIGYSLGIGEGVLVADILEARMQTCTVGRTEHMEGLPRQFRPQPGNGQGDEDDDEMTNRGLYAKSLGEDGVADMRAGLGVALSAGKDWKMGGFEGLKSFVIDEQNSVAMNGQGEERARGLEYGVSSGRGEEKKKKKDDDDDDGDDDDEEEDVSPDIAGSLTGYLGDWKGAMTELGMGCIEVV